VGADYEHYLKNITFDISKNSVVSIENNHFTSAQQTLFTEHLIRQLNRHLHLHLFYVLS